MGLSFGQIAVDRGFITPDQLKAAQLIQEQVQLIGLNETLEEILLKKGWITPEQITALHSIIGEGVQQIIPGYEVLEKLGKGGMGAVYKARRIESNTIVAIKTLSPGFASQDGAVDRFLREAKLLMKLHHENLVAGLDAGFQKGVYYYVMECVEGMEFAELIKRRGRVPWREALRIAKQAAAGLQYAAANGIVHRDIKPENIMIASNGVVKLADLGIAKIADNPMGATLTSGSSIIGTPQYMSPEQAEGRPDIDHRTDMYSLGLTLYAAVNGAPPFEADTPIQILQRRVMEDVPVAKLRAHGVPDGFINLMKGMCARNRAERYSQWDEIIRDMTDVEQGRGVDHMGVAVGADSTAGMLGRLAISHGFISPEQLQVAVGIQEKLMKAGVRKLLGTVLVEEGFIKNSDLKKLLALQSFQDRHNTDKSLGDLIVENGIAPAAAVEEALRDQKEAFQRDGFSPSLDQILVKKGVINDQQRRAVLRLSRRMSGANATSDVLVGVKECPSCVEVIPLQSLQCPKCHYVLEKAAKAEDVRCVACSTLQTRPGEYCERCGCNVVTGRPQTDPRLVACLSCGNLISGSSPNCSRCGEPRNSSVTRKVMKQTGRHARRMASHLAALAIPILVIGGIVVAGFFWMDGRSYVIKFFRGREGEVRVSAEHFLDANQHRDYVGAARMFHNRNFTSLDESESAVLAFQQRTLNLPGPVYRLTDYTIERVMITGDTATVYLKLTYTHAEKPLDVQDTRSKIYLTYVGNEWRVVY